MQRLLAASPENQFLLEILHGYFSDHRTQSATAIDGKFHAMMGRSEQHTARKRSFGPFPRYAAAAAILLMVCGGWYFLQHNRSHKSGGTSGGGEMLAGAGARTRMILPDGTKVWLHSKLLRGAVKISRQDNPATARVILRPNEKLMFSRHLSGRVSDSVSRTGLAGNAPFHAPDISVNRIHDDVPDSDKVETAWMYTGWFSMAIHLKR